MLGKLQQFRDRSKAFHLKNMIMPVYWIQLLSRTKQKPKRANLETKTGKHLYITTWCGMHAVCVHCFQSGYITTIAEEKNLNFSPTHEEVSAKSGHLLALVESANVVTNY